MGLISVDEVRGHILSACSRLAPKAVPLDLVLGCVLAEAVTADQDVPSFANTAMDGFAVRSSDTARAPVRLQVTGTIAAGSPLSLGVGSGEAVRIMTGAPMPPGADAVVMVEATSPADAGGVMVEVTVVPGQHVRYPGEDLAAGQSVFTEGTVLTPGHIGVLASLGQTRPMVYPRARVGVLSTGDELVDGPQVLQPGQIRDSNRPTLMALVSDAGCDPVDLGTVGDDEEGITEAIEGARGLCDVLVTSGGVSVGDFDYTTAVLSRLGTMNWWQVAVKPAKPLAFGLVDDMAVFGLPGNPVSSMVSFELFARPALRQMMGHSQLLRRLVTAVAGRPLRRRPDGKLHLARVTASIDDSGSWSVDPCGGDGSHLLWNMAQANALALLPDGGGVEAGGRVQVMLLHPSRLGWA